MAKKKRKPAGVMSQRIQEVIRIPVDYAEVKVDCDRKDLLSAIDRIVCDDEYRLRFNKNPIQGLKQLGIHLDETTLEKLGVSPLVHSVRDMQGVPQACGGVAIVIIGVIIGVIAPPKPAE